MLEARGRWDGHRLRLRFYTSDMERKLESVLFVDIVDSTRIVTGADPEVVRRRVTQFFDMVSQCVAATDAVVHLAARPSVPRSIADPMASHVANATGTVISRTRPSRVTATRWGAPRS